LSSSEEKAENRDRRQLPAVVGQRIFSPKRHKVLHDGRGSAKSWTVARVLLMLGMNKPMRVLCTREVQKSMEQSVHKLLDQQISNLGLTQHYTVQNNIIRGVNGTEFVFAGLRDHVIDNVRSYEGIDLVWIEEAESVSCTLNLLS